MERFSWQQGQEVEQQSSSLGVPSDEGDSPCSTPCMSSAHALPISHVYTYCKHVMPTNNLQKRSAPLREMTPDTCHGHFYCRRGSCEWAWPLLQSATRANRGRVQQCTHRGHSGAAGVPFSVMPPVAFSLTILRFFKYATGASVSSCVPLVPAMKHCFPLMYSEESCPLQAAVTSINDALMELQEAEEELREETET